MTASGASPRRTWRRSPEDELIDGLRLRKSGKSDTPGHTSTNPSNLKGVDTRHMGPLAWVLCGAIIGGILVSCLLAGPFRMSGSGDSQSQLPVPAVTVTVTETKIVTREVETLSIECRKALIGSSHTLDSAAAITSANNQQLDIMSATYVAIVTKDWKKLNALAQQQRDLERSLKVPTVTAMLPYKDLRRDIDECLRSTKSP